MPTPKYALHLKGYVGGWDFDSDYVDFILSKNSGKEVSVLIDSLGGQLNTALSISSAFRRHGNVHAHFVGMNASAATIASMGAKRITMDASAMYLVHQCSHSFFEWAVSTPRICSTSSTTSPNNREALLIALEKVAKYYREQFLQSKEAQAYAYNRWGKDYCTLIDMGFSPDDGRGINSLNLKTEFLKELGLINRGGYDALHGRIVILIKDRSRRVIGFTARTMGDTQPKYLNSSDSILFHKSKVLFGIDAAWRTAAKQEKFFLVEGAPDCMRLQSIGVLNTVAVLGSAYGEQHYSIIKKVATKVCFLPDDDPPKQGETFGHGIQVVMDAGKRAMECGLSVSVKEIPDGTNTHKQDPDSYYTSQIIFNAVEETDFILWLADKLFPLANTTEEQRQTVKRIAYLLSLINDETGIQMYIGKLCKFYQGKRLWQQAVDAERKAREESAKREDDQRENDLYKRYGFYVDYGEYMSVNEKGGVYEWSNFTMMPLFHIKDNINPKRIYKIKNKMNH